MVRSSLPDFAGLYLKDYEHRGGSQLFKQVHDAKTATSSPASSCPSPVSEASMQSHASTTAKADTHETFMAAYKQPTSRRGEVAAWVADAVDHAKLQDDQDEHVDLNDDDSNADTRADTTHEVVRAAPAEKAARWTIDRAAARVALLWLLAALVLYCSLRSCSTAPWPAQDCSPFDIVRRVV